MSRTAAGHRESHSPSLVGSKFGRYEVLTQLASGGMATVYIARAQGVAGFERLVAIKLLHPHLAHEAEFISMFLDEARLAARIHHPNVVSTVDISDTENAGYFLVMDYVEGDHLGALLQQATRTKQRIAPDVVVRIVLDALAGLGAAHNLTDDNGDPLRLVHRDVSPHNVLVGVDGVARLTDFGIAKAEVRLSSTREGQFKGKLSYMAPEQASDGCADQRSDLFSMGILLWEALAFRRLFRGENNAETLNRILELTVEPPSAFVPEVVPLDDVCLRALARIPEDRFQTPEEFAETLEETARTTVGIASIRKVSDAVRLHAADKLEHERQRIRQAIVLLGRSELTPTPTPARPSEVPPSPPSGETRTMAARPSSMARRIETTGPSKKAVRLGALAFLVAAGAGWAALVLTASPEPGQPPSAPESVSRPEVVTPAPGVAAQPAEDELTTETVVDAGSPNPIQESHDVVAPPPSQTSMHTRSHAPTRESRSESRERADPAFRNPYRR